MTEANLSNVNFSGTNFDIVNFTDANLEGSNFTNASFNEITSSNISNDIILPQGYEVLNGYIIGPSANLANTNLSDLDLST